MPDPQIGSGPAALPRELADFLLELSIALHRHALYPGGHPSLAPATERVVVRLHRVLADRPVLSLGVARHQLVIEGVATDPGHPVLRDLAGRLHRHHLGAISFRQGLTADELHRVLEVLAVEADRTGQPLGLGPRERLAAWPHVRLYPLTYERLDLVAEAPPGAGTEEVRSREERARAAQLWLGLARAALAADAGAAASDEAAAAADPAVVARAIQAHPRGTAYDQVIVGYLLQIAEELKAGASPEEHVLRQRVSKLITQLDTDTLQRLLEMGGDRLQRRQFVLSASSGLAVDAVVELLQAASRAERETVSHGLLRMLSKLAQHAQSPSARRRELADRSLREQVAELVQGWSLADPNPDAYRTALQRMAASPAGQSRSAISHPPEPERIVQMALELEIEPAAMDRAVEALLEAGGLASLLRILAAANGSAAAERIWARLTSEPVLRRALAEEPLDLEALGPLLDRAGLAAAEPMLDALSGSESGQTRRTLIDRLILLGPAVGPLAAARLGDASWYVQRNMLVILRALPERPPGFDARPWAEHPDARVRREAFRLLFDDPAAREWALCRALTDSDPRTVRLGLNAALAGCPEAAVPLVASLARKAEERDQRLIAIRALGAANSRAAVAALLALVRPVKRLFWRRSRQDPEYRAAVAALRGLRDWPEVRQALARLGEE